MTTFFLNSDLVGETSTDVAKLHMLSLTSEQAKAVVGDVSTGLLFSHPDPECGAALSVEQLQELLNVQLIRFTAQADLNHVKLDPALSALAEENTELRSAFLHFVRSRCLITIVCPIGSKLLQSAQAMELPTLPEIKIDQHYSAEGVVVQDSTTDETLALTRLQQVVKYREFTAEEGSDITLDAECDQFCVSVEADTSADVLDALRSELNGLEAL